MILISTEEWCHIYKYCGGVTSFLSLLCFSDNCSIAMNKLIFAVLALAVVTVSAWYSCHSKYIIHNVHHLYARVGTIFKPCFHYPVI